MYSKNRQTGFLLLAFACITSSTPDEHICVQKYGGKCIKNEDCAEKLTISEITCGKNETQLICCSPASKAKEQPSISKIKCAKYADKVIINNETLSDQVMKPETCEFEGEKSFSGSKNVKPGEFPFMALIGFTNDKLISWQCGGSLISSKFILSAAQCSFHRELGIAKWALLGDLNISSTDDAGSQLLQIKKRINHPNYNSATKYHGISLYELSEKATINKYVRPACLQRSDPYSIKGILLGWGTQQKQMEKPLLQKTVVTLTEESTCDATYGSSLYLPTGIEYDKMFCAEGSKDVCIVNDGTPIIDNSDHYCTYTVIGVSSFGMGCGKGAPDVFVRVSYYIQWIESVVWPDGK